MDALRTKSLLKITVIDSRIIQALSAALDDYTTDQRGDVGSLVRIQAIEVVAVGWRKGLLGEEDDKRQLLTRVCRLAAEKLDKVRFHAWLCIQEVLGPEYFSISYVDLPCRISQRMLRP